MARLGRWMAAHKGWTAGCLLAGLSVFCVLCGLAWTLQTPVRAVGDPPLVRVVAPVPGQMVRLGETLRVQAVAQSRDPQTPVVRLLFWADGQAVGEQPGPGNPLTGTWTWMPESSGTHVLVVQAVDAQGRLGVRYRTLEVVPPSDDPDGDGVSGEADLCPNQIGSPQASGCPMPAPDQDGDRIPDVQDACPAQAGTEAGNGCPFPASDDQDGDGLPDAQDSCPNAPGPVSTQGCPPPADADGDTIPDVDDPCPNLFDPQRGCPPAPDEDGDGVPNNLDACPNRPGPAGNDGCPMTDDDGDGIANERDACPQEPGPPEHGGCPAPDAQDADGDGVTDAEDACPEEPGPPENVGCPWVDTDGDTIPDPEDACPEEAGPPGSDGCPHPDGDGDGVPDEVDLCDDLPGPEAAQGCPLTDEDGDGIPNEEDSCPLLPGPPPGGCPDWVDAVDLEDLVDVSTPCQLLPWLCNLHRDDDGDGLPNGLDACPERPGPSITQGCPWQFGAWRHPWDEYTPGRPGFGCFALPDWICAGMGGEEASSGSDEEDALPPPAQVEVRFLDPAVETAEQWLSLYCAARFNQGWVPLPADAFEADAPGRWRVDETHRSLQIGELEEGLAIEMICWGWRDPSEGEQYLGQIQVFYSGRELQQPAEHWATPVDTEAFRAHFQTCPDECP